MRRRHDRAGVARVELAHLRGGPPALVARQRVARVVIGEPRRAEARVVTGGELVRERLLLQVLVLRGELGGVVVQPHRRGVIAGEPGELGVDERDLVRVVHRRVPGEPEQLVAIGGGARDVRGAPVVGRRRRERGVDERVVEEVDRRAHHAGDRVEQARDGRRRLQRGGMRAEQVLQDELVVVDHEHAGAVVDPGVVLDAGRELEAVAGELGGVRRAAPQAVDRLVPDVVVARGQVLVDARHHRPVRVHVRRQRGQLPADEVLVVVAHDRGVAAVLEVAAVEAGVVRLEQRGQHAAGVVLPVDREPPRDVQHARALRRVAEPILQRERELAVAVAARRCRPPRRTGSGRRRRSRTPTSTRCRAGRTAARARR